MQKLAGANSFSAGMNGSKNNAGIWPATDWCRALIIIINISRDYWRNKVKKRVKLHLINIFGWSFIDF